MPSVLVCVLGEVYISHLIALLNLQSKLAEIGIKMDRKFYEHDPPPLAEIVEFHGSEEYIGLVLCSGNVGFEPAAVLEGLIESVYAMVPAELDLCKTPAMKHIVGFIAMPKERIRKQTKTTDESFLDAIKTSKCLDTKYKFVSVIEHEFRGDLAQRNMLKIRS